MIKINKLTKKRENEFLMFQEKRFERLKPKLDMEPIFKPVVDYFYPSGIPNEKRIRNLLIGDINDLKNIIGSIGPILDKNNTFRTAYNNFHISLLSCKLSKWLDLKTCPYCNRNYIFHFTKKGFLYEFDHYFPISEYPYLALSLYNLIPACSLCNLAKSAVNPCTKPFMYPYSDEFGYKINFKIQYNTIFDLYKEQYNFDIIFDFCTSDKLLKNKANEAINTLHLNDYYNKHKDDAFRIIKICQLAKSSYVSSLQNEFSNLFLDENNLIETVIGTSFCKDDWKNSILSKFNYDIFNQFY